MGRLSTCLVFLIMGLGPWAGGCGATAPLEPLEPFFCQSDRDCTDDRVCRDGSCVPDESQPDEPEEPEVQGEVGDSCESDAECLEDYSCIIGFPAGYCTTDCGGGCPEGSVCVSGDGWEACLKACEEHVDCREGYGCYYDGSANLVCLPTQGGGHSPVGGPCERARDCQGEPAYCWTEWPGGYCMVYNCDLHGCPQGSSCYSTAAGDSICYANCNDNQDCGRDEYACWPVESGGICLPHCSVVDMCFDDEECNTATGVCEQIG